MDVWLEGLSCARKKYCRDSVTGVDRCLRKPTICTIQWSKISAAVSKLIFFINFNNLLIIFLFYIKVKRRRIIKKKVQECLQNGVLHISQLKMVS